MRFSYIGSRKIQSFVLFIGFLLASCFFSGIQLYGLTPFPLVLTIVLLFLLIKFLKCSYVRRVRHESFIELVIFVFLFLVIISGFWAINIKSYTRELLVLISCIIAFFIIQRLAFEVTCRGEVHFLIISTLWVLFFSASLSSLLIFLEAFGILNFENLPFVSSQLFWRPEGLLGEPNFGSILICIGIACGMFLFIFKEKRTILIFGVVLGIMGIIFSGSRTGLLLLILSFFGFILVSFKFTGKVLKIPKGILLMFVSFFVVFALITLFVLFYDENLWIRRSIVRIFDTIRSEGDIDPSIIYRLQMWNLTKELIDSGDVSLLLGNGFGSSLYVVGAYLGRYMATHNTFIAIFFELGIVGLLLWICICIGGFVESIRIISYGEKVMDRIVEFWGRFALICIIVFIVASFSLQILTVTKMFWMFLGLITGINKGLGYYNIIEKSPY